MKRNFLIGILALFMCFTLVGCGNNEKTYNNDNNNQPEQSENNQNQQDNNSQSDDNFEIKSTDNKLVFVDASGMNYSVFHFENDKIVKYEVVVKYPSVELARIMYESLYKEDSVDKVSIKGTYIIVEENADKYDDLSKTELEESLKMAGYKINE